MLLLAIVATSVAGLITGAQLSTTVADHVTRTTAVASAQVDSLASLAFDADGLQPGGSLDSAVDGYSEVPSAVDEDLFVHWQITDESSFMKRIDVRVGVTGRDATLGRETTLTTFKILME